MRRADVNDVKNLTKIFVPVKTLNFEIALTLLANAAATHGHNYLKQ